MAPITAIWANIVYAFDLLSGSIKEPHAVAYDHVLQIPVQPSRPLASKYPKISPPDEEPFTCEYPDYPAEDGWQSCHNNTNRHCWIRNSKTGKEYNISTDYESDGPKGIVRKYYLELNDTTLNPDGFGDVYAQLFNGSLPGPRLQACWGDQLQITILNNITGNGTSDNPGNGTTIHWHGLRQWNTATYDGVNGVTQCPIPPGESYTYTFNVTQYGTTWYHSHYSLQYAAGALAPFTIYGPSSKNYDYQLYPIIGSDWLNRSVYAEWAWRILNSANKSLDTSIYIDNVLQNGIGQWPPISNNMSDPIPADTKFNEVLFQRGARYLMRIINGAADTTFIFSIDHHSFHVISTDFVAVEPYYTDHVVVGIGQRYNIIVEANPDRLSPGMNYWMRMTPSPDCSNFRPNTSHPNGTTGIVRYRPGKAFPTTTWQNYSLSCMDETYNQTIHPIVNWTVPEHRYGQNNTNFTFYLTANNHTNGTPYYPCDQNPDRFELIPSHSMWLNFSDPPLLYPRQDWSKKPWLTVVDTETNENWVQLTIISGAKGLGDPNKPKPLPQLPGVFVPGAHPIHLHGHDFVILEQCVPKSESKPCDIRDANPKLNNPPRRDVAFMPNGGYLIIAFKADNPGNWIMHCHIAFHASMGLAVQILENVKQWRDPGRFAHDFGWDEVPRNNCRQWNAWNHSDPSDPCMCHNKTEMPIQIDSGI